MVAVFTAACSVSSQERPPVSPVAQATVAPEAAVGGLIAFIHEGDSVTIDSIQLKLELNVDEAEIARRKVGWVAPKPRYTRGVQAKFAFNVSTASKGAVLDDY